MKKCKFLQFCVVLVLLVMTSCSSDTTEFLADKSSKMKVANVKIGEVEDPVKVQKMFNGYSIRTRAMNILNQDNGYDFAKSQIVEVEGKDAIIYAVPSKESQGAEKIMVGISDGSDVLTKMYFVETSNLHYTLYNQDSEPILDAVYDKDNCIININNFYGNDATVLPYKRAKLSKRTWSLLCNGIIAVGCTSLGLIGAIPTAGATIGMAACTYIISSALC